ncbi:hypothetical protein B0H13DRAFT_2146377, partial [Mycena leptocephala]
MYKQNTTSNECSDEISAESDGLIGSYGIADRDPKRGDINFLSIGPLALFAIAISPPFLPRSTTLGARLDLPITTSFVGQSCWHRRGPRHRYAIGLEPYTGLLNAIVQNHPISVMLIVGFFGGDVSNLEWSWASRYVSKYFPLSSLNPHLAHRGLFLSSRTLIHPATPISRFPVDCK